MNILLDALPEEIDGVPICSDFARMVQFELMMADASVSESLRLPLALDLLYEKPVSDLQRAVDGLLWFYSCGAPSPKQKGGGSGKKASRAYDFEQDAPDIYAAFMQTYGIDLNDTALHWWKFRALLNALPETCKIVKIMGYRTMDLSDLKGKERKFYAGMKERYRLRSLPVERLSLAATEQAMKDQMARRFAAAETWAKAQGI